MKRFFGIYRSLFLLCLVLVFGGFSLGGVFGQESSGVSHFISEDGLAPGVPSALAVDPGGWVWVGTRGSDTSQASGFSIINNNRRILSFDRAHGIGADDVTGIHFDHTHNCIWFTTNKGISRWDGRTGTWRMIDSGNSGLTSSLVTRMVSDGRGKYIVATDGGGLFVLDPATSGIEAIKSPYMSVTDIVLDSKGRLWASSAEGVAYRQDMIWVTYNKNNSSLPIERIDALAEMADGTILCGTQRGIVVYDGFRWSVLDSRNSKLPVDMVTGFLADNRGGMWISTNGGGVAHMNRNREIGRILNRRTVNLLDNRILSMAQDQSGNLWLGTSRGVSQVTMVSPGSGRSKVHSVTVQAYDWVNRFSKPDQLATLQLGLVRPHYVPVVWSWVAFFAEHGFDTLEPQVSVESSLLNNQWLNVRGAFPSSRVIQVAVSEGDQSRGPVIARDRAFPFPGSKMPAEIALYLKPGALIPSDDPEIRRIAESLVRPSSKDDMLKTVEDILFSKFFATMPYDFDNQIETATHEPENTNPRTGVYRTPREVLKDMKGISYSKNRLAVTLLKAAGVPARLVAGNGETYWGEAYIHGAGWYPFDVTMPVYAIDEDHLYRVQFPSGVFEEHMGVVSVSSSDDTLKQLVWLPFEKAVLSRHDMKSSKEMLTPAKLKTAKFLLVLPSTTDSVPLESRIPVAPDVSMVVRKESSGYWVKFYDKAGKIFNKVAITQFDETMTVGSEGDYSLTFIPTLMGEHVMLRILGVSYYSEVGVRRSEVGSQRSEFGCRKSDV